MGQSNSEPATPDISRDQLALERTRLANERTLLAYGRTALMLGATGVTVLKFFGLAPLPLLGGWLLIAAAVAAGAVGWRRFQRTSQRISG
ncbi:MAG: DUF202 domain-containing protein [Planctomycetota bacterium]